MQSLYTRLCCQHILSLNLIYKILLQKTAISTSMHINEPKYVVHVLDCPSLRKLATEPVIATFSHDRMNTQIKLMAKVLSPSF